ncbi:putative F-box domain-containing protein [Seiridium cardinale]|uniref:F-box domain-containing protein n=1 Tax=Seiridium cardinale TaxID=138064 RepID=A0ABR2XSY3_9PEZI
MDMSRLPRELIINVAEQMDIATLVTFTSTNKAIRELVQSYEGSICQARIRDFPLQPTGNVLSSSDVERHIRKPLTFPSIYELELRQRRIHEILQSGFIDLSSPPGLDPLTPAQQGRYAYMLQRSLCHCDAIADIAANSSQTTDYNYALISGGYWSLASGVPMNVRHRDPFMNIKARSAQIEYLKALPVEELASLYMTITAVASGHARDRPAISVDPAFAERITVFEECTLRHGTWFLWAQAAGEAKQQQQRLDTQKGRVDLELRAMTGHMLLAGFSELISWETGLEHLPAGLRMSVLDAAKNHFEQDRPAVFYLYKVARKMIFGADDVESDSDDDDDGEGISMVEDKGDED